MKNKAWYMVIGGLLALVLVFGAAATFAQIDEETETPDENEAPVLSENGRPFGPRGFGQRDGMGSQQPTLLADALGITVEELTAAYEAAQEAAVEEALSAGLITEEQADRILDGDSRFRPGPRFFGGEIDFEALLADALGVSVEELQAARDAAQAARLAEMVEAGVITQEQADMIAARQAVQDYYDVAGVAEMLQEAYETAVQEALDAGDITQEQADQLIENYQPRAPFSGGPGGFRGHRGHGGPGGFRGPGAGGPGQGVPAVLDSADA